jgi:hypothetical protein
MPAGAADLCGAAIGPHALGAGGRQYVHRVACGPPLVVGSEVASD